MASHQFAGQKRSCRLPSILLLPLVLALPLSSEASTNVIEGDRRHRRHALRQWRRLQDERIDTPSERFGERDERLDHPSSEYSTPDEGERNDQRESSNALDRIVADTVVDHSFDSVDIVAQQYKPTRETDVRVPDIYDPDETETGTLADELAQEIPEIGYLVRSVDASSYESNNNNNNSKRTAWIAHGTIAILTFGLILPASISSALFRDILPEYWIYLHVFLNVAVFFFTAIAVFIAFTTMNSLGDVNEGHLKELHHVVGLGLLLLVSFQTANGFLRPPREFVTEDQEDSTPGAIHSSDWEERKLTPRTLWYLVHRLTGIGICASGTWQVQSGLEIYARKFGGAQWGGVYLGYAGWLVFVIGGAKLYMVFREKKRENKNNDEWSAGDELFDTDSRVYDETDYD